MGKLTYEDMLSLIKRYFDTVPSITGPESAPKMMGFFSKDYKNYMADIWATGEPTGEQIVKQEIFDRKGWVDHLCGHANLFRAKCFYEPYPLYIMIDDRKNTATVRLKEQKFHPETGKSSQEFYMIVGFEFTQDEKGKALFKKEYIISYPDKFIEVDRITK